ncbi:MAG: hypothetical protein QME49_03785 [bacterium]|nr:hypothetical protein [bacterium]
MYDHEKNDLLVVFSPVTDRKFVIDPQEKVIHLSTCPSLTTRSKKIIRMLHIMLIENAPCVLGEVGNGS